MRNIKTGLTNNQLKIIAILTMLCDHVGRELLPQYEFLTIIGRIAFPIFAYMISEGCHYTRNRRKYLTLILELAFVCQSVFFITTGSMYQSILITFSLSIALIFSLDNFKKKLDILSGIVLFIQLGLTLFLCVYLPYVTKGYFQVDYGIWGALVPVAIYYAPTKNTKLLCTTILLSILAYVLSGYELSGNQWYSLFAVPLLLLYNGERGELNLKYLFYIFYPTHLAIIYLIKIILQQT